jgi:hypothetical protein
MKHFTSLVAISLFALAGCKKVDMVNPSDKELFGEWRYVSSSGGYGGSGHTGMDNNDCIEFKQNGKYLRSENGKKTGDGCFKFDTYKCIHGSVHDNYGTIAYMQKKVISYYASFKVSNDTLYLDAEAHDGISYVYVRK